MSFHALNPETANTKIDFIKNHLSQTHIIADFDGTLTKYFDDQGKARPALITLLYNEGILDEDYSKKAFVLQDKYIPIEHDSSLPFETREAAMVERWTTHKELLMEKGLNIKHIEHITSSNYISMRSGVDIFLKKAHSLEIPVIIFSASGIGTDSISLILQHRGLLLPNIHIVSNKLYRDQEGNMIGYKKPVIHALNKTEVVFSSPEYDYILDEIANKPHTIIIGDGVGDPAMATDKEGKTILRVGLCNDKVEARLPHYEEIYDVVITHDEGLEEVYEKIFG